jgi:Ring finger domain
MTTAGSADTSNDVVDVNVDTADVVNGTTTEPLDVPPPPLDLEQGRGVQDTTDTTAVDASKPHCDTATTEDISMIQESPIYDYVTEDDDDAAGFLQLRSPNGICHERLPVPNLCAICLGHYQVGDAVVWSRLQCPHVFHQECILDWFINVNATDYEFTTHWIVKHTTLQYFICTSTKRVWTWVLPTSIQPFVSCMRAAMQTIHYVLTIGTDLLFMIVLDLLSLFG